MAEFDFLARIPMGQYLSTGSVLHRLDPRAKVTSFHRSHPGPHLQPVSHWARYWVWHYLVSLTILSKINLKFALKSVITPLPFLFLFAVIQVFFYSSAKDPNILFSIWILRVTLTGIMAGLTLLLRFIALILTLSLATFCVSTSEGIQGCSVF